ncbi:MAG TPA: hypothetical protein VIY48_21580 [Candidatus Paceibacterota bacterium]
MTTCPNCKGKLPDQLQVSVTGAIVLVFNVGARPGAEFQRISEVSAKEVLDIDKPAKGTHLVHCPTCNENIDLLSIKIVPTCSVCGKEKEKMVEPDNVCYYDGLVCLECAKARAKTMCKECSRSSRCVLFQRATKAIANS